VLGAFFLIFLTFAEVDSIASIQVNREAALACFVFLEVFFTEAPMAHIHTYLDRGVWRLRGRLCGIGSRFLIRAIRKFNLFADVSILPWREHVRWE